MPDALEPPPHSITFRQALRVWVKVALLSFGGPAGQIAVMHRVLVDEKKWISESRFLHALSYCTLLPGPEAQQLAVYIGWLLHRTAGGLVAGILFILPGFLAILVLSVLYALYQDAPLIDAVFYGLKPAVMAVVVEAVVRIGRRVLRNGVMVGLAAGAFIAIFFLQAPFPLIVMAAGLIGFVGGRLRPDKFHVLKSPAASDADAPPGDRPIITDQIAAHTRPTLGRALLVLSIWLPLWLAPVALLYALLGPGHVFTVEGTFFSKMAVVTFGGAYAALAYVAQRAVETYHWVTAPEMLDGLGLAETTPGPLIMVLQFVGFLAAYRNPGGLNPVVAGVIGSVVTTWVTFVPCFLWIFLGAPYIEHLRGQRLLSSALSAVTAAVVGVILNLAVWFALHVLFPGEAGNPGVEARYYLGGALRVLVPDVGRLDVVALVIAAAAFVAMFKLRWDMIATLGASTAVGLLWRLFVGS